MRRAALSLAIVAVLGCQRSADPRPREPEPEPPSSEGQEGEEAGPSLEEIADTIDPGPQRGLSRDIPGWVDEQLGLTSVAGEPEAMLAAAREQLEQVDAAGTVEGEMGLAVMVALARALVLAERATASSSPDDEVSVETLLLLERIYAFADIPMLADDHNPFIQAMTRLLESVGGQGDPQVTEQLRQVSVLVGLAVKRAGDVHRHTVARLLRKAPEHPAIPDVLARLAPRIVSEDEHLAVGVLRRSMFMRGSSATAEHWLDLSMLCHRTLDTGCGREALAQAEEVVSAADPEVQQQLQRARALAKSAYRAVELQDAVGLDDGLELGESLHALDRYDEARATFEQLMRLHPDDARPVLGLARVELADRLDFVRALEVVEQSEPREHRGIEWYELAIGVRATVMLYQLMPQVLGRPPAEILEALRPQLTLMRADIDALEALGADEGRVLRFLYQQGMAAWPKIGDGDDAAIVEWVRQLLPRVRALQAEIPQSSHAYLLLLTAAEFSADRQQALAVIDVEPPGGAQAEALAYRRAQAAFDLVTTWDADERVADLLRLCEGLEDRGRPLAWQRLAVDARVLARRLGGSTEDWAELERRYRALLELPDGAQDALVLNNLAVVVAERGRMQEAVELWLTAVEYADDDAKDLPRLNALAAHLDPATAPTKGSFAASTVETLAESSGVQEVRLLAHAWLVSQAKGKERRRKEATLRERAAAEAVDSPRPRHLPGRGGVVLRGSFEVGLGYSNDGMELKVDVHGVPWLVLPPSVPIPDPRNEGPARGRKRSG